MMEDWIKFGQGILLVFSINDYESFEKIKRIYDKILKINKNKKPPMLLVGNKLDLENERVVSYSEAKELAESWGVEYCEISSKNGFDCQKVIEKITKKVINLQRDDYHPPSPSPLVIICEYICCSIWYYPCCCFLCYRK